MVIIGRANGRAGGTPVRRQPRPPPRAAGLTAARFLAQRLGLTGTGHRPTSPLLDGRASSESGMKGGAAGILSGDLEASRRDFLVLAAEAAVCSDGHYREV